MGGQDFHRPLVGAEAPSSERVPRWFALRPIVVSVSVFQKLEDLNLLLQPRNILIRLLLDLHLISKRQLQLTQEAILLALEYAFLGLSSALKPPASRFAASSP